MKKFITEFKEFIAKGNAMDMAVGIIIGAAFTAIVTSLVDDIVTPLITLITGGQSDELAGLRIPVGADQYMDFGAFIGAIINFIIIAFVVFLLIKGITKIQSLGKVTQTKFLKKDGVEMVEEAPVCPFCQEEVNVGATRCPHCTSDFEKPAEATLKPAE